MPTPISLLPNLATVDGAADQIPIVDDSGGVTRSALPSVITRAGLLATGVIDFGSNNVTTTGTIAGRDVAADGTAQDSHIAAANPHSGSLATSHEGAGGAVHAAAIAAGASGFMTGAQVTKLDGIAAGAQVNVVEFDESTFRINDTADATKQIDFEAGAITTGTTRTINVPDADVDLRKNNYAAAVAPGVSDDGTSGYAVGSVWIDTTADTAYVCLDASTGAAVWQEIGAGGGSGVPDMILITSPSTADYYGAASGVCDGAADFTVHVLYQHEGPAQPSGFKDIARNDNGSTGWAIAWNFGNVQYEAYDGSGNSVGGSPSDFYASNGFEVGRAVCIGLQCYQSGGVLHADLWFGALRVDQQSAAATGMTVSTGTMNLCSGGEGEGVEGLVYYEGTLTDAQMKEYAHAVYEAGAIVALPVSATNRWSAAADTPGATWAAAEGASSLQCFGTPVSVTRKIFRA